MAISEALLVGRDEDTRGSGIDEAHEWMRELVRDGDWEVELVFRGGSDSEWREIRASILPQLPFSNPVKQLPLSECVTATFVPSERLERELEAGRS